MTAEEKEMAGLMGEHETIRAQMLFLANSLSSLANAESIHVKERMWNYRQGLYDFRDAVQLHIELDERIFKELPASISAAATMNEHEKIRALVDDAIRLADNAIENDLGQEELAQSALDVSEAFSRIYQLIKAHTDEEDRLLRLVAEDL